MQLSFDSVCVRISGRLLNNALDIFLSTAGLLAKEGRYSSISNEDIKSGLISISSAIEILLKAKIASIDWREIFPDPSKADESGALAGSINTIQFSRCIKKCETVASITFQGEASDSIEQLRLIRNKISHYSIEADREQLLLLLVKGMDIFIEFYREHIFKSFFEEIDRTRVAGDTLKEVREFVQVRVKTIRQKIKEQKKPITNYFSECTNCLQAVFTLKDDHTAECMLCGLELDIKEMAQDHSHDNGRVQTCPVCTLESMTAVHQPLEEPEAWDCVVCGHYINRPQRWLLRDDSRSVDFIMDEYRRPVTGDSFKQS